MYVEILESDECDCEYDDDGRLVYECICHLEVRMMVEGE
jgi:hypothetical protein